MLELYHLKYSLTKAELLIENNNKVTCSSYIVQSLLVVQGSSYFSKMVTN